MQPQLKKIETFSVTGIQVRTLNTDEANPATAKLPALWRQFFSEHLPAAIESSKNPHPEVFGVYSEYESDANGYYNLLAGIKTSTGLSNEKIIRVQSGLYLVFDAQGTLPEALIQEWGRIWSYFSAPDCQYQRAYTTDFEQYLGPARVAIHIAIKTDA